MTAPRVHCSTKFSQKLSKDNFFFLLTLDERASHLLVITSRDNIDQKNQ